MVSVVGENTAVVGLGVSCIASYQIRTAQELLAKLTGDSSMVVSGMVFDWLVCEVNNIASLLRANEFVPSADTINTDMLMRPDPYWPKHNVHYWHEYIERAEKWNRPDDWSNMLEKYKYMGDKFRDLRDKHRLVFVLSNAQNNLNYMEMLTGSTLQHCESRNIEALFDVVDGFFGRACEFIVATYPDRLGGEIKRKNTRVYFLPKDNSDWTGDEAVWARLFTHYFTHSVVPKR